MYHDNQIERNENENMEWNPEIKWFWAAWAIRVLIKPSMLQIWNEFERYLIEEILLLLCHTTHSHQKWAVMMKRIDRKHNLTQTGNDLAQRPLQVTHWVRGVGPWADKWEHLIISANQTVFCSCRWNSVSLHASSSSQPDKPKMTDWCNAAAVCVISVCVSCEWEKEYIAL